MSSGILLLLYGSGAGAVAFLRSSRFLGPFLALLHSRLRRGGRRALRLSGSGRGGRLGCRLRGESQRQRSCRQGDGQ